MKEEITITREQMSKAVTEVATGDRMKPLVEKSPILMLAFVTYGAELLRVLFEEEENKSE